MKRTVLTSRGIRVLIRTILAAYILLIASIILAEIKYISPARASELAYDSVRHGSIPVLSLGTVQTVSYTATSAATSSTVGGTSRTVVLILCKTDCHVVAAASPTATTSDTLIPAMTLVWIWVNGGTDKLAFIRVTADGTAYVTEAP